MVRFKSELSIHHTCAILLLSAICAATCSISACTAIQAEASLRGDIDSMIGLMEEGKWNEMAENYVVPPRGEDAKRGLEKEYNQRVIIHILKEIRSLEPEFSADRTTATFHVKGDDIPNEWRFERSDGRWRLSETR